MRPDWLNPCPTPYNDDSFARHFDLEEAAFPDRGDVAVWLELAESFGDPVLELGCGTGRVMLPLVGAGYDVTGIDESTAMLEIAREKLREIDPDEGRFTLRRAGMDDYHLNREFPLIVMPDNALWNLTDPERQRRVMFRVAEHLREGGVFLAALMGPGVVRQNFEDYTDGYREQFTELYNPLSGSFVTRHLAAEFDPRGEMMFVRYRYDERIPGGGERSSEFGHYLRIVQQDELAGWAAEAGLFLQYVWGDWNGDDYSEDSPLLLAALRKPPGS